MILKNPILSILLKNQVSEARHLDCWNDLPGSSDSEKKEFLSDVSFSWDASTRSSLISNLRNILLDALGSGEVVIEFGR